MKLIEKVIRNGGDGQRGLPIGNLTSQFFANVYLNVFDHFIKRQLKCRNYIRYMDDFVIFENDNRKLKDIRKRIENFLENELELQLKREATFINKQANGLSFLGKRIFIPVIRIDNKSLKRMRSKMLQKRGLYDKGKISEEKYIETINSYFSLFSKFTTNGIRRQLIKEL